jgi:hypothetical protein
MGNGAVGGELMPPGLVPFLIAVVALGLAWQVPELAPFAVLLGLVVAVGLLLRYEPTISQQLQQLGARG